MTTVQYSGEIWQGPAVQPLLWDLLLQQDRLVEISYGQPPFRVTVGIPHHAGPGIDRIASDWINPRTGQAGRPADETTGLAGLALFSMLRERSISCKLVIAAHPTDHDPNKTPGCPYWQSVFAGPAPDLLLELHGAARHRRHTLELSAGQNEVSNPLLFGKMLAYYLNNGSVMAVQKNRGSSKAQIYEDQQEKEGRLQNPALETLSLAHAGKLGIPALHLEMKFPFRQPDPDFPAEIRPTPLAWQLANALADVLELEKRSDPVRISAAEMGLPSTAMLLRPSLEYQHSYLSATSETSHDEMNDNPELRIWNPDSLARYVEHFQKVDFSGLPGDPPEEYLWLVDRGEFIGRLLILHWLNEYRLKNDGQVDYWIRPSKRRQGYGYLILRLALERFRQLGLERVLISCREDNIGSRKIIEANGGIYEKSIHDYDLIRPGLRRRYWIPLM